MDRDLAYTFALFRDCGMPVIAKRYSDYKGLLAPKAMEDSQMMLALEVEGFGVHHALVGAELARSWGLGEDLCSAISYHHDYAVSPAQRAKAKPASLKMVAVGWIADQVVGAPLSPLNLPAGAEFVLETLRLDETELVSAIERVKRQPS